MSELIQKNDCRATIRWKLLTGASAFALAAYASSAGIARAEDSDHPIVWLEFGGQAERIGDAPEILSPSFFGNTPAVDLAPMVKAQQPPPFSLGLDGKISFTPENSDWVLSAAIRYGKSSASRHKHQQTAVPYVKRYFGFQIYPQPIYQIFGDGRDNFKESHSILDFQVGKDVGLGMFGAHGSAVVSAGVRFAQFTSGSNVALNARPSYELGPFHSGHRSIYRSQPSPHIQRIGYRSADEFRHTYAATLHAERSARAVGPSLSWNASLPVAGNSTDMTLDFDWGLNAAILFGRQRTRVKHETHGHYYSKTGNAHKYHYTKFGGYTRGAVLRNGSYTHGPSYRTASRRVTIPNVGGFAGISLKFPNAKVSLGYRADFFFNAMDGGIDVRKEQNRSFMGPYASISVGIGD